MKTIKKLASIALALVMVLCLTAPALAANVTIKLPSNANEDTPDTVTETYKAYKIFNADVAGEEGNEDNTNSTFDHVAYSISDNSPFYDTVDGFAGIKLTEISEENGVKTYHVSVNDDFSAADFAAALRTVVTDEEFEGEVAATGEATLVKHTEENESGEKTYSFDYTDATLELGDGYFLIVGSLGSKAILDTVGQENVTITTKNDLPTIEKEAPVPEGVKIGDSIPYTITVNAKPGAAKYMVHDTMGKGLTYNGDVVVTVGGTVLDASNYTVETDPEDGCAFHLSFTQAYLDTITEATDIVLTYTATINNEATISVDTTTNKAKLDYGENGHTEDSEDTQTETPLYSFDLVKTTSDGTVLPGATFALYESADAETPIAFIQNGDTYRPATAEEITDETIDKTTTITAGNVTVMGLGNGTYYLEELEAPDGYNKVATRIPVEINGVNLTATIEDGKYKANVEDDPETEEDETWNNSGIQVVNLTGAELPSTGGIGTTIFYIAGGVLAVGAGILLVTKKRVGAKEE